MCLPFTECGDSVSIVHGEWGQCVYRSRSVRTVCLPFMESVRTVCLPLMECGDSVSAVHGVWGQCVYCSQRVGTVSTVHGVSGQCVYRSWRVCGQCVCRSRSVRTVCVYRPKRVCGPSGVYLSTTTPGPHSIHAVQFFHFYQERVGTTLLTLLL